MAEENKPAVSRIVASIAGSVGRVLNEAGEIQPKETEAAKQPEPTKKANLTLGERFADLAADNRAEPEGQPPIKPAAAKPAAATPPPAQPAAAPAQPAAKPASTAATPPAPKREEKKEAPVDVVIPETHLPHFNEEDKDEFQIFAFAERAFAKECPDASKKFLEFIDARKQFVSENPNATEDDLAAWNEENAPQLPRGLRRRIEMGYVTAKAKEQVRAEMEEQINPVLEHQREIELKPQVDAAIENVISSLDTSVVHPDIIEAARKGERVEGDDIEFPVVAAAINAGRIWANIGLGIETFDVTNPAHQWIVGFVANQSTAFKKTGGDALKRDGKDFMPYMEFYKAVEKDPTVAEKFFTWSDDDVLKELGKFATAQVSDEVAKLKKYEARRNGGKAPTPPPAQRSTQVAARPAPGAKTTDASPPPVAMPRIMAGLGVKTA